MKIYLDGSDNLGWHIDVERENILKSIERSGVFAENSWNRADIIHNLWWNNMLSFKKYFFRFKKNVLVTASNFVNLDDDDYELAEKFEKVKKMEKI